MAPDDNDDDADDNDDGFYGYANAYDDDAWTK